MSQQQQQQQQPQLLASPAKIYHWKTHDGRYIPVNRMATSHMFNVIRMLFDHGVEEKYRLQPCKWRINLTQAEVNEAVEHIMKELSTRELTIAQIKTFHYMQSVIRHHLRLYV